MEYMTAYEAAGIWGVSLRQVQRLLAGGRIPAAKKYGRSWMIPAGADKPADPRRLKAPFANEGVEAGTESGTGAGAEAATVATPAGAGADAGAGAGAGAVATHMGVGAEAAAVATLAGASTDAVAAAVAAPVGAGADAGAAAVAAPVGAEIAAAAAVAAGVIADIAVDAGDTAAHVAVGAGVASDEPASVGAGVASDEPAPVGAGAASDEPGAVGAGVAAMDMPTDASTPTEVKTGPSDAAAVAVPAAQFASDFEYVISVLNQYVPRDNPDSALDGVSEERLRLVSDSAFAYFRGDYERVLRCYRKNADGGAAKLFGSLTAIVAAISIGDYSLYVEIESYLETIKQAKISAAVTAFAELTLTSAYLGALAPNMMPDWLKEADFTALPPQLRPNAAWAYVKYLQTLGRYETILDVARMALGFCDSMELISQPCIYLRTMCAAACCALGRADEGRRMLRGVMRICLPYGFITPFSEMLYMFGGMAEQLLEREFPEHFNVILRGCKRVHKNWLAFHNRFTKDNITLILSLREYEMALLAVRGVPNAKIAEQFHISLGRLKIIMHEIYGKLYIKSRKDLAQYII